jgi:dynein heavy chain
LDQVPHNYASLEDTREQLGLISTLWKSTFEWSGLSNDWQNTPFKDVDAQGIKTEAERYFKNVNKCEKAMEPNPVVEKLKQNVLTFKEAMPVVVALRNDKLKENHWAEIQSLINKPIEVDDVNFTLKSLIDMDVNQYADEIGAISMQATQEHNLRL